MEEMERFETDNSTLQVMHRRRRYIHALKNPSAVESSTIPEREYRPLSKLSPHCSLLSDYKPKILKQLNADKYSELLSRSDADDTDTEIYTPCNRSDTGSFRSDVSLPVCQLRRRQLSSSFLRIYRPNRFSRSDFALNKDETLGQHESISRGKWKRRSRRRFTGLLSSFNSRGSCKRYRSLPRRVPSNRYARSSAPLEILNTSSCPDGFVAGGTDTDHSDVAVLPNKVAIDLKRFPSLSKLSDLSSRSRDDKNAKTEAMHDVIDLKAAKKPVAKQINEKQSKQRNHVEVPTATLVTHVKKTDSLSKSEHRKQKSKQKATLLLCLRGSDTVRAKRAALLPAADETNKPTKTGKRMPAAVSDRPADKRGFFHLRRSNKKREKEKSEKRFIKNLKNSVSKSHFSRREKIRRSIKREKSIPSEFDRLEGDFRNVLKAKKQSLDSMQNFPDENLSQVKEHSDVVKHNRYVTVIKVRQNENLIEVSSKELAQPRVLESRQKRDVARADNSYNDRIETEMSERKPDLPMPSTDEDEKCSNIPLREVDDSNHTIFDNLEEAHNGPILNVKRSKDGTESEIKILNVPNSTEGIEDKVLRQMSEKTKPAHEIRPTTQLVDKHAMKMNVVAKFGKGLKHRKPEQKKQHGKTGNLLLPWSRQPINQKSLFQMELEERIKQFQLRALQRANNTENVH